jgi:DNA-binding transcriptional MerR regulator
MTSAERLAAATLTIAELAAHTGLSADTLRYYEKANLISTVGRSAGEQRRYAASDLVWIEFLLRLRDTGMSIVGMQQFAGLRRDGRATVAERLALLRAHRLRLAERIQRLQANGAALDENPLLPGSPGGRVSRDDRYERGLRPAVSTVFELGALPKAFRAQRAARPAGKVIINVGRGTP